VKACEEVCGDGHRDKSLSKNCNCDSTSSSLSAQSCLISSLSSSSSSTPSSPSASMSSISIQHTSTSNPNQAGGLVKEDSVQDSIQDEIDTNEGEEVYDDGDEQSETKFFSGYKVVESSPKRRFVRFNDLIGEGSFKRVFRGWDSQKGVEVAWNTVRVDSSDPNSNGARRVIQEMRILQTLNHPGIIKFFGSWLDHKKMTVIFITELISSGSLQEFIQDRPVCINVLRRWCRDILSALEYLHSHQPPIIHRDLKCENVFINGCTGDLRLGDLGLASWRRDSLHRQSILGTPEYMAPELYDEHYDEKVDIYAFGMCVLEMVVKEVPYSECGTAAQIFRKVTRGEPPAAFSQIQWPAAVTFIKQCIELPVKGSCRPSAKELLLDTFLVDREEDNGVDCADFVHDIQSNDNDKPTHTISKQLNDEVVHTDDLSQDPAQVCTSFSEVSNSHSHANSLLQTNVFDPNHNERDCDDSINRIAKACTLERSDTDAGLTSIGSESLPASDSASYMSSVLHPDNVVVLEIDEDVVSSPMVGQIEPLGSEDLIERQPLSTPIDVPDQNVDLTLNRSPSLNFSCPPLSSEIQTSYQHHQKEQQQEQQQQQQQLYLQERQHPEHNATLWQELDSQSQGVVSGSASSRSHSSASTYRTLDHSSDYGSPLIYSDTFSQSQQNPPSETELHSSRFDTLEGAQTRARSASTGVIPPDNSPFPAGLLKGSSTTAIPPPPRLCARTSSPATKPDITSLNGLVSSTSATTTNMRYGSATADTAVRSNSTGALPLPSEIASVSSHNKKCDSEWLCSAHPSDSLPNSIDVELKVCVDGKKLRITFVFDLHESPSETVKEMVAEGCLPANMPESELKVLTTQLEHFRNKFSQTPSFPGRHSTFRDRSSSAYSSSSGKSLSPLPASEEDEAYKEQLRRQAREELARKKEIERRKCQAEIEDLERKLKAPFESFMELSLEPSLSNLRQGSNSRTSNNPGLSPT